MPRSPIDRLDRNNMDSDSAWQRTYASYTSTALIAAAEQLPADTVPCPRSIQPPSIGRGPSDAAAAWQRWHGNSTPQTLSAAEKLCYSVLERARVETLASLDLPGIAHNLADLYPLQPADDFLASVYRLARHAFATQEEAYQLERSRLGDSPAFTRHPSQPRWSIRRYLSNARVRPNTQSQPNTPGKTILPLLDDALSRAGATLTDGKQFADAVSPVVTLLAGYLPSDGETSLSLSAEPQNKAVIIIDNKSNDAEKADDATATDRDSYRVFSRQWDEEVHARTLYEAEDAALLAALDTLDKRDARRLAHQLQRRIQAAGLRRWSFDLEEGVLDSRRLSRLLAGNNPARIFRQEQPSQVAEACVTLLVDQSGSMRGLPQLMVMQALDLLVHTLESCRIPCEVLGYTTRFSDADNPLYRHWTAAGSPANPGRLNALRHIIYKPMAQPWRRCRPYIALMNKPSLGKENIDGEALAWAAGRLLLQPQPRKILLVLGDGAPYDGATVNSNGKSLLENHLHKMIKHLESAHIQLSAIGTSTNVGRFYHHALSLQDNQAIAQTLFQHMADLLLPTRNRPVA